MNVSDSKDIEHEKYKNNIIFFLRYMTHMCDML